MFKKIAAGLGILVGGLVVFIVTRPSTFAVERSRTIAAEPDVVFTLVDDFHHWPKWSPWEGLDPNIETTFGGAESGTGATYDWTGNEEVGTGKMTITASDAPRSIVIDLQFIEPWASRADNTFTFEPDGEGTRVTWSMSGDNDFMGKAMSLFMDVDTMIGADFERGLDKLAEAAEAGAS